MIVNCKNAKTISLSQSATANAYLHDIRKYVVLSPEEQRSLIETVKYGNPMESDRARTKLIESNQRFVISFAKQFATESNVMDLIQEANIGLIEAINNYDLKENANFISYAAHWMRKYINEYLATTDKAVVPANAQKIFVYAKKAKNLFYQENHREPTVDEAQEFLKTKFGVKIAHAEDLADYISASIDETMDDNDDAMTAAAKDFTVRTSNNNINDFIEEEDLAEQIKGYLAILNEKERDMVLMSYGIGYDGPQTNDTIGEKYGLCAERVRQILKKSESKLANKFGKTGC